MMQVLDWFRVVLFGLAVRRAVTDYLRLTGLIMFILLMVAWTIDLAEHFPKLRAGAETRGVSLLSLLAPYLGYRSVDMITRLLPMACFFGVFLAEIFRRLRLESVILAAAGASPVYMLSAVLWLALILGSLQNMMEARWRPAAVLAQVDMGFGSYAARYRRTWLNTPQWFVDENTTMRAQIKRTDQPELRNILVFQGLQEAELQGVIAADHGYPTEVPMIWRLDDVRLWDTQDVGAEPTALDTMTIKVDLVPLQLSFFDIPEVNIPTDVLLTLAELTNAPNARTIQSALWRRYTAWLLPPAVALMAIIMANAGFLGRVPVISRHIALAATGYVSVVMIKVFWALGELAVLSVPLSIFAPILLILALSVIFARHRL